MQDIDLTSIGRLSGQLQTPVSRLSKIIATLNIVPQQRLNGIGYYHPNDVERIAAVLRERSGHTIPTMDRQGIQ
ncbi:hypothetical protein [Rhodopirellula bahusiensis]|uniref:HTH merR-type domain-containing protein n=1 Tax=Rhodopirellula bahusiensis TaxID=2014065 RepID=A0A2G1W079_9BACT|nr:hypothetical protein [Rhodopirellula bahusiensis]PHQ32448.1 hypothetical protein CEE69_25300 [Rhodopirellula bahusiensis]